MALLLGYKERSTVCCWSTAVTAASPWGPAGDQCFQCIGPKLAYPRDGTAEKQLLAVPSTPIGKKP